MRLLNMGYDYRSGMKKLHPTMTGPIVGSYKDYLRDDIVCCVGADMPAEKIMARADMTATVLDSDLNGRREGDPPMELLQTGIEIAEGLEEARQVLPKGYLIPMMLNYDLDYLALQLAINSRVFRSSGRFAQV
jgi:hypothetical protein